MTDVWTEERKAYMRREIITRRKIMSDVDEQIREQLEDSIDNRRFDKDFPKLNFSDIQKIVEYLEPKINRLITGAYNKGYSDGRLVKPKYKVGDIAGNYQITERFRRVGKNTKYKVVCILCGAPMFRYSNKFNLKHKECGAIKND